jgi:hypothetical protein
VKTKTKGSPWYRHPTGIGWKCLECGRCNTTKVRKCSKCGMAKVTIDSSGQYVPRMEDDKTKSQSEAVPVEERNLPAGDVAMPEVQDDQQEEAKDVSKVRGTDEPGGDLLRRQPICNSHHNRHEMIVARCHKCFAVHPDYRERLQELGWRLFVELRIEDHEGFEICPVCAEREYSWEDLY